MSTLQLTLETTSTVEEKSEMTVADSLVDVNVARSELVIKEFTSSEGAPGHSVTFWGLLRA